MLFNLNRICLTLIEKVEVLEATNVAIMSKKALVDKALSETKKEGNKLQDEWKTEKIAREAKKKEQDDKMQELKDESQQVKDMPTSEEGNKVLAMLNI